MQTNTLIYFSVLSDTIKKFGTKNVITKLNYKMLEILLKHMTNSNILSNNWMY